MSAITVKLEVAVNLLLGKIVFPEQEENTKRIAKILHISLTGNKHPSNQASTALEKGGKPFLGLGGYIVILKSELGELDLSHPSHKKKFEGWFQEMSSIFPKNASVPCAWAPDDVLESA